MVLNIGKDITTYSKIQDVLDATKGKNDKKHYFYIIKMPECGKGRIKIGITMDIHQRFTSYQSHFFGTQIKILRLRVFPDSKVDRYGYNARNLYAVFEDEAKKALRNFNKKKIQNGSGSITEWFDKDTQTELLKAFDAFVTKDFANTDIEKTLRKTGLRTLKDVDYKEKNENDPFRTR